MCVCGSLFDFSGNSFPYFCHVCFNFISEHLFSTFCLHRQDFELLLVGQLPRSYQNASDGTLVYIFFFPDLYL